MYSYYILIDIIFNRHYSSDDLWEDFSIDNDFEEEEISDVPFSNETANTVPNNCIYGCKNNEQISLCPMCSVKVIFKECITFVFSL